MFARGAWIASSGGVLAFMAAVALSVHRAREAKRAATYGSARWAEDAEIRAAGLLGEDGVVLGKYRRAYLRHDGPEHEVPKILPLPGQLKLLPSRRTTHPVPEIADPTARVTQANLAARIQPTRAGFINAVQVYPYSPGALYQVYTSPGEITDIMLQQGEKLVGTGPVAAGDTVRWIIGDTESGAGTTKRIHILVKPTRPDLTTNLIVNTDRRTYLAELRSTPETYMAFRQRSWMCCISQRGQKSASLLIMVDL